VAEALLATRDWHPPDHGSFREQGGIWPVHCVAGTEGAELHHGLDRTRVGVVIDKGQDVAADGYSGFEATLLEELLRANGVDHVTIGGIATDYCVKNTALDALRLGFGVTVDRDAVRRVEVEAGDSERALDEIRAAGGAVT
jgi:nicotinamidase/pyrazinamidase